MLWVSSYIFSYFIILLAQTVIIELLSFSRHAYEQPGLGTGLFFSAILVVPLIAIPVSLVMRIYLKNHRNKKRIKQFSGIQALLILLTIGMLFVGLLFLLLYPSIVHSEKIFK